MDASTESPSERTQSQDQPTPAFTPEPVGYRAVPDGTRPPPSFDRQRVLESEVRADAVAVTRHTDGLVVLLFVRSPDAAPKLLNTDPNGAPTGHQTLTDLPTDTVYLLERVGDVTVLGGTVPEDPRQSWLRGYREGEVVFTHWAPEGWTYSDLAVDGEDFVVAGSSWPADSDRPFGAILRRIEKDGTVRGETVVEDSETSFRFWAVTVLQAGLFAAGSRDNRAWLVRYDADGSERWRQTIDSGEQAYNVKAVTTGPTGTYALAETNQFATGNNHLLVLSIDDDGSIRWTRIFDPNYEQYGQPPQDLHAAGLVDAGGPVLAGPAMDRVWLGATDPEGALRWAGYHQNEDLDTLVADVTSLGDQIVLNGRVGRPNNDQQPVRPWLAWLYPTT